MSDAETSADTRPSLLLRLRDARDDEAWSQFVEVYTPLVYGYLRRKGLQDADAADVTQSVLLEVVGAIRTFEYQRERGRFRDWLGRLAARGLGRFLTAKNRSRNVAGVTDSMETTAEPAEIDAGWDDEFNVRILQAAMDGIRSHFEPATWRAFERVWLDNTPAADAARELGLSIESVYVAKSRILKRLEQQVLYLAEDVPQFVPLR